MERKRGGSVRGARRGINVVMEKCKKTVKVGSAGLSLGIRGDLGKVPFRAVPERPGAFRDQGRTSGAKVEK